MNKNDIRIQAYIDSELNDLLARYAKSHNLTLSAAISQILKEKLYFSTQLIQNLYEQPNSGYVTHTELDSVLQGVSVSVPDSHLVLNDESHYVTQSEFKELVDSLHEQFADFNDALISLSLSSVSAPKSNRAARRAAQRSSRSR